MPRAKQGYWKQKDGQLIRIGAMTDLHLLNTIRFLIRAAAVTQDTHPYPSFQGEEAQYQAEQEWDRIVAVPPEIAASRLYEQFDELVDEAELRKLDLSFLYQPLGLAR